MTVSLTDLDTELRRLNAEPRPCDWEEPASEVDDPGPCASPAEWFVVWRSRCVSGVRIEAGGSLQFLCAAHRDEFVGVFVHPSGKCAGCRRWLKSWRHLVDSIRPLGGGSCPV